MPPRDADADLTLRQAAKALGLSMGTVRAHVKAGKLKASRTDGKYGPEYRLRPAVVAAYGAEHLGLELDAAALARVVKGQTGEAIAEDVRELYERLLVATGEATRYKALAEVSDSERAAAEREYQGKLAELQYERDAAQVEAAAAKVEADKAAAELERLRRRGFFARVFGGNG